MPRGSETYFFAEFIPQTIAFASSTTFEAAPPLAIRSTCAAHAVHRAPHAFLEFVFLIDADDAAEAPAHVVEGTLDHVQVDAKPRHAGRATST